MFVANAPLNLQQLCHHVDCIANFADEISLNFRLGGHGLEHWTQIFVAFVIYEIILNNEYMQKSTKNFY